MGPVPVPLCDGDVTWSVEFCLAARAQSTLQKRFRFILLRSSGLPQISQLPMSGPRFCGGWCGDCWWFGEMGELASVVLRFFGGSSLLSLSGYRWRCTGNGSGASCITNPSITCVSTFGLIIAFGSPPLSLLPVLPCGGGRLLLFPLDATTLLVVVVVVAVDSPFVPGVGVAATAVDVVVKVAAAAGIELVVVVVSVLLLVVVVDVVVLTAPADSSDEATAGSCPAGDDAGGMADAVGAGGSDEAKPARAAAAAAAAGDAALSIGVAGPFNCASEALSGAAVAGTRSAKTKTKQSLTKMRNTHACDVQSWGGRVATRAGQRV